MEGTKLFNMFSLLLHVSFVWVLLLHGSKCETYTVGDDEQWSTGVNYYTWSTKYDYKINDTLVFKYIKGEHDVYEVTEDTYRSCNSSRGVLAKYASGNDQIKLTEAKEYWFICNIAGHCLGGMRFSVNLTEASSAAPTTETDKTPSSSSNNSSASKPIPVLNYLFVLGIFLHILSCFSH